MKYLEVDYPLELEMNFAIEKQYVCHSSNIQGLDSKSIYLVASHDLIVRVVTGIYRGASHFSIQT